MEKKNYPNSGALFNRKKASERAADMGGDLTFEGEVLDYILRCVENREPVKIELAAWRRSSNSAGGWLSLKAEIPYEIRKGQSSSRPAQGTYPRQQPDRDERPRDEYRGGRSAPPADEYRGRENRDYNPRHDTQIGGSQRDYNGGRGRDDRRDDDFPPRRGGGLDRL